MDERQLHALTHPYSDGREDLAPYRRFHDQGDGVMATTIVAVDR